MDVSSLDPPLMGVDLSTTFSAAARTRGLGDAMDLAQKPEWYRRQQVGRGPEPGSPFRCRSSSSSYGSLSARLLQDPGLEQHLYPGHRWHPGCYGPERPAGPAPESSGGEESDSDSDVIFLVSSTEEPLLCSRFIPEGHMVAPLSPAASSPDGGGRCFHLPRPLSSPSADSSFSDESSDSSLDVLLHRARPVVLLSELGAVYGRRPELPVDISSDDSDVIEVSLPVEGGGAGDAGEEEAPPAEVRRSGRVRRSVSGTPPLVCRTSRRRLQRRAKNDTVGIYYESCESDDVIQFASRLSGSDADGPTEPRTPEEAGGNHGNEPGVHAGTDRKSPPPGSKTVSCGQNKQKGGKQRRAGPERRRDKPTTRWRSKRRRQAGAAAGVSPREPDIKLRFAGVREEKKRKDGGFCPFVHVEKRSCVIVNFQEDEEGVRSPGRRRAAPRSAPGFVPNTSCLQLCRFSSDGGVGPAALLCCLCGQTANAVGLGDLHGPYRPAGAAPRHHGHNAAAPVCNGSAADPPQEAGAVPKVPPERWIHEDCGIWAAGVFLVRGRLYGLEEAARLAQETVCSVCQQTGAIMGCFLKSCPKSFHYRCAIQTGCVLNEDNFSLRCSEHKRKVWTSRRGQR